MNFEQYLQSKNYSITTIKGYLKYIGYISSWAKEEGIHLHKLRYQDLMTYVRLKLNEGSSKRHINQQLTVIRHYWNYLVKTKQAKDNIAVNFVLKGVSRRLPHDLLTAETLEKMYESFPVKGIVGKRNKVILGLFVYQGLRTDEIRKLEPSNVNLNEGKIYVPGNRRTEGRTLDLKGHQILLMNEYLNKVRGLILAVAGKESDNLFFGSGSGTHFNNVIMNLSNTVRGYMSEVKDVKQIRASVITNWLEHYNIRQVQYMAGHRYVSSTERYQKTNLDDLKNDLSQFHPLR